MAEPTNAPIGLTRGLVRLEAHHAGWARLFAAEAARLADALAALALRIEHVGSTAVPGLIAKPILDIVVALRSLSDADEARASSKPSGTRSSPRTRWRIGSFS